MKPHDHTPPSSAQLLEEIGGVSATSGARSPLEGRSINADLTKSRPHCLLCDAIEGVIGSMLNPPLPTMTTGLRDLDTLLRGGLPVGAVSAIAGRPGMALEEFARYVAFSAARQGVGVLYFSFERSRNVIALHGLAEILDVKPHWLINPSNQTDALGLLDEFSSDIALLSALPIVIDDTPTLKPDELRERVVALCRSPQFHEKPAKLLIVDSLVCLHSHPCPSADLVKPTLMMLNELAKAEGIHILCTAPVLRQVEDRESHEPKLFDLWGEGMVERFCDPVIAIYRDSYYHPDHTDNADMAQIIVLRNSMPGATGSVMASFNSGRFGNFDLRRPPAIE